MKGLIMNKGFRRYTPIAVMLLSLLCTPAFAGISLYKAVITGDLSSARSIISQGADINKLDKYQVPLLNHAVNFQQHEMVKLLLESGADANGVDKAGWTALIISATYGYDEIARLLMQYGAMVETTADGGESAISQAQQKNNKSLMYDLIRGLEKQQRYNLAAPKNLANQLDILGRELKVKDLPVDQYFKTNEAVIQAYSSVMTPSGESLVLQLLNLNQQKQYTSPAVYIQLLLLAQQYIAPRYWFYSFSLYGILDNSARFREPLRDMFLQTKMLTYLLNNFEKITPLIINNRPDTIGHIQPDLSLEILLRFKKLQKDSSIFSEYFGVIGRLQKKLAEKKIDYSFTNIITTLASPDSSNWIKQKVRRNLELKIKQNRDEIYHINLVDLENKTYIYIGLKLPAENAENIINAIQTTDLESIYSVINSMKNPNKKAITEYALRAYGIEPSVPKDIKLITMRIKGEPIDDAQGD